MTEWSRELASVRRVAFDTNALIYALNGTLPYARLVWEALAMTARGMIRGVVPTVVALELLVKPMRDGDGRAIDRIDLLLDSESNLLVRPLDRPIARRAATVRAQTGLSLADSVVVATALEERCDVIIGNDWRIASRAKGIQHLYLDDYVP